jgi:hypothetical protein
MNNEPVAWMHHCLKSGIGYLSYTKPPPLDDYKPIPLYTHPSKTLKYENHEWDRGIWTVGVDGMTKEFIESSDFHHDVRLYLNGDFETDTQRLNYLQHIADRLNAYPAKTLTDEEIMECFKEVNLFTANMVDVARAILRKASEK